MTKLDKRRIINATAADELADNPRMTPVKRLQDATAAICDNCNTLIEPNAYWTLAKSIHLHKTGSCGSPKITYWGFSES